MSLPEFKLKKTDRSLIGGTDEGAVHSFSESERRGYVDFINQDLAEDDKINHVLPIDPHTDDVFEVISDGVLLARLMENTFEGTIDNSKLCLKPKNMFEKNLNHDLVLEGAQTLKLATVNIGATDFLEKKPHLVMGLMWQIIKKVLMHKISLSMDLSKLAEADEAIDKVPPEQILLRWFNYHLKNANHDHRVVTNFSSDIADAECYAVLLREIAPKVISAEDLEEAFRLKDPLKRAELVLDWAKKLDCLKFVTPQDIVDGNPRLNLAFVATLFDKFPKLGPTEEELLKKKNADLECKLGDVEGLLSELTTEKDTLQETLDQTKLDFDQLSMDMGDLTLELGNVKGDLDDALGKVTSLEEMLEAANNDKSDLSMQLQDMTKEKDDLFAQLEEEMSLKLDLEEQLQSTKNELDETVKRTTDEIESLTSQLENEIQLKNDLSATLEETMMQLESTRSDAKAREEDLLSQLTAETDAKEELQTTLDTTLEELEETMKLKKEAEQTKEDLFKILTDTISELESTKKTSENKELELNTALDEERKTKEEFALKLQEKSDEFDKSTADWADERAKLLARIKELEEELEALKIEMRTKLEESERAKEEALAKAKALMESALGEAEHEKNAALDKMRMLLQGSQKSGYLHIYMVSGLLGTKSWTKRYFVLRDNLFAWYKSEQHTEKKPLGVIYVEEARLYEMEEGEVGKPLCFQITTGGQKWNIAAESMEEMRSWMTEIRIAKKKKLGHKVVAAS